MKRSPVTVFLLVGCLFIFAGLVFAQNPPGGYASPSGGGAVYPGVTSPGSGSITGAGTATFANIVCGTPPASPNNLFYVLGETPSGGLAGNCAYSQAGVPFNPQVGGSYTVAATDRGAMITQTIASAYSIPLAGTTNFSNNFFFAVANIGVGTVTFTPVPPSTISTTVASGALTFNLLAGQTGYFYSDNSNYLVVVIPSPPTGVLTICPTGMVCDNFNRANNASLGGNWTVVFNNAGLTISGNQVIGTTGSNAHNSAVWSANTFNNDQACQFTVTTLNGTDEDGCLLRYQLTGGQSLVNSGYLCQAVSGTEMDIYKVVANSYTRLAFTTTVPTIRDVDVCTAVGTTLTMYRNGVQTVQVTDATYASGFPGIDIQNTTMTLDNFAAWNMPVNGTLDVQSVTADLYQTSTSCAANGTAANPSVVTCGSAAAGMFSCATAASTGTCTVNTTAVTPNSIIQIVQDDADGGASQLNVTCNTGDDLPTTKPLLHAKVGGTSFTINLGTVTTNPGCFEYEIKN
jgi:hypothetical protein